MPELRSFFTGHFTEFRAPDISVRNAAGKKPVINAAAAYKIVFCGISDCKSFREIHQLRLSPLHMDEARLERANGTEFLPSVSLALPGMTCNRHSCSQ